MKKIKKVINLKIISLLITAIFIFESMAYASPFSDTNKLRVPINNDYSRLLGTMQIAEENRQPLATWRSEFLGIMLTAVFFGCSNNMAVQYHSSELYSGSARTNISVVQKKLTQREAGLIQKINNIDEVINWNKSQHAPGIYQIGHFNRAQPTVLFIHGAGGTPADFKILLEKFENKFNIAVFSYDYHEALDNTALLYNEYKKFKEAYQIDQILMVVHSFGNNILIKTVLNLDWAEKDMFKRVSIVQLAPTSFGSARAIGASNLLRQFAMKAGSIILRMPHFSKLAEAQDPEGPIIKAVFQNYEEFLARVDSITTIFMTKDRHLPIHGESVDFNTMYERLRGDIHTVNLEAEIEDGHAEVLSRDEIFEIIQKAIDAFDRLPAILPSNPVSIKSSL